METNFNTLGSGSEVSKIFLPDLKKCNFIGTLTSIYYAIITQTIGIK